MINRQTKKYELKKVTSIATSFGETETETKFADIEVAVINRAISTYNINQSDMIKYDYVGLTQANIEGCKGCYLVDSNHRYIVNHVLIGGRYNTLFLSEVA